MIKNLRVSMPKAGDIRLGSEKGTNSPGRNLPFFRVESALFEKDFLEQVLGKEPTSISIHFPRLDPKDEDKSLDFIFDTNYKCFRGGRLYCQGNGEKAFRSANRGELVEVDCTCELLGSECKQRAELRVGLSDLVFMGYFQVATSAWNSLTSISAVIDMYHRLLKEDFWSTKFILYKEEMVLGGRKQWITKLAVHPDFRDKLPKAGALAGFMISDHDDESPVNPMQPVVDKILEEYVPKTKIGESLLEIRKAASESGEKFLTQEELEKELDQVELPSEVPGDDMALPPEIKEHLEEVHGDKPAYFSSEDLLDDSGIEEIAEEAGIELPLQTAPQEEAEAARPSETQARDLKHGSASQAIAAIKGTDEKEFLNVMLQTDPRITVRKAAEARLKELQGDKEAVTAITAPSDAQDANPGPPPAPRSNQRILSEKRLEAKAGELIRLGAVTEDWTAAELIQQISGKPLNDMEDREIQTALATMIQMVKDHG